MKWHARFGQALALAVLCGPTAAAEIYMSADDYLMGSQQERWGFVQGVYDTYGAVAGRGDIVNPRLNAAVHNMTDCATKVSVNELEQTFTRWLESNPDRWNERMPSLFLSALGAQCAGSNSFRAQGAKAAAAN